jgi:hypothetical protein
MVKINDNEYEGRNKFLESVGSIRNIETQPQFNWYAVPHQNEAFEGAPKMFAFSWKAPTAGHIIGVSTEVPEEFRKYWAVHEFLEEDKPQYAGRCLDTLKQELGMVPNVLTGKYIPLRAGFFRGLVDYAKANNYSSEQVEQFTLSRDHLNGLEARLNK